MKKLFVILILIVGCKTDAVDYIDTKNYPLAITNQIKGAWEASINSYQSVWITCNDTLTQIEIGGTFEKDNVKTTAVTERYLFSKKELLFTSLNEILGKEKLIVNNYFYEKNKIIGFEKRIMNNFISNDESNLLQFHKKDSVLFNFVAVQVEEFTNYYHLELAPKSLYINLNKIYTNIEIVEEGSDVIFKQFFPNEHVNINKKNIPSNGYINLKYSLVDTVINSKIIVEDYLRISDSKIYKTDRYSEAIDLPSNVEKYLCDYFIQNNVDLSETCIKCIPPEVIVE